MRYANILETIGDTPLVELKHHYNRTFKAEQNKSLKEKKASRSSSPLCDILEG